MRRRQRSVYRCNHDSGDSSPEINGTIHNAFPEINAGVKCGYYFPVIDCAYVSPLLEGTNLYSRVWHEMTHKVVSGVASTCERQYLTYLFLAHCIHFLEHSERFVDTYLMVPSFTIVEHRFGRVTYSLSLRWIAEKLGNLIFASGVIQEIIANTAQAEEEGWDRKKTIETIKASMTELTGTSDDEEFVKAFLTEQLLEDWFDAYDRVGLEWAYLIARYPLNTPNLSKEKARERFQRAVSLVRKYERTKNSFSEFLVFQNYLTCNLPGFLNDRCPLITGGGCMVHQLKAIPEWALCNHELSGTHKNVIQQGVRMMERADCGERTPFQYTPFTGSNEISGIGFMLLAKRLNQVPEMREIIGEEVLSLKAHLIPFIRLSLLNIKPGAYRITIPPSMAEEWEEVYDAKGFYLSDLLFFESIWQQLWQGTGPLCFCDPDIKESCPYRPVLAKLWTKTVPDPGWAQNWKVGSPPECIRDLI
jgi:hypothetical protein